MPNFYSKHIPITPYQPELVLNGIRAVKNFDPKNLRKLPWPQEKGCRKAQGGDGGQIVVEDLRVVWQDDKLIFPISEMAQPVAERKESNIQYLGLFVAQLDGEVAYCPSDQNIEYFYILVENVDRKLKAVRFSSDETALLDPFVKHSMPIPSRFGLDYSVFHRASNAIEAFLPDPAEPVLMNMLKVDRSTPLAAGRIPQRHLASSNEHFALPKSFAKKLMTIEEANAENFESYGQLISDPNHVEEVSETPWPGVTTQDGLNGLVEQDFQMVWIETEAGNRELVFKGFSGTFAGEEGRPGVEYLGELGLFKANLLMARPDGSFYLRPASTEVSFAMSFALAKNRKGEPDEATLKRFLFAEITNSIVEQA